MLAIVGIGAAVNRLWPAGGLSGLAGSQAYSSPLAAAEPLTRVQVLAGSRSPVLVATVVLVTATAFAVFLFRHWRRLHRYLNQGEAFVYRHAWLDIAAVFVFTAGFVLTRSAGFIH